MFSFDQRGAANQIVLGVIALVIIVGGIWYFSRSSEPEPVPEQNQEEEETINMNEEEADEGSEVSGEESSEGNLMLSGEVLAGNTTPLIDFNQADYDKAITSDKLVVLYFYANWCPLCKIEVANALYPAFNELTNKNVVGFRVNYKDSDTDTDEEALAREYNITYQHTKIFVKNGERLLKAPDTWDKDRYLSEIANAQ